MGIGLADRIARAYAGGIDRGRVGRLALLRAAYVEYAYWARQGDWNYDRAAVAGSSYYDLPRVMHWLTGNIGYHHLHHLAPRIPNYRLRAAFQSSAQLQCAPRLTLWTSVSCARMKLWDEERGRMVGFAEAGEPSAPGDRV